MTGYYKCSPASSDIYDVYYMNQGLLSLVQTGSAEYPPGEVWTLDEDRRDATVEDICDFIVQYINSDVMVCASSVLVIWCSHAFIPRRAC
jgi:hypothetical protein